MSDGDATPQERAAALRESALQDVDNDEEDSPTELSWELE